MKLLLPAVLAACAAFPSPLAAQGATPVSSPTPLVSQVFEWSALQPVKIPNGERRQVFDGPTATVDKLHCHITSLAAGQTSGAPRRHLEEEVLIVKEGQVEVHIDGRTQNAGAGSVLFFAAGAVTALRAIGDGPATYYVINYLTPKTPKS
jgi:XRE family transcriptional regulator, regulator of sulfur utilization